MFSAHPFQTGNHPTSSCSEKTFWFSHRIRETCIKKKASMRQSWKRRWRTRLRGTWYPRALTEKANFQVWDLLVHTTLCLCVSWWSPYGPESSNILGFRGGAPSPWPLLVSSKTPALPHGASTSFHTPPSSLQFPWCQSQPHGREAYV